MAGKGQWISMEFDESSIQMTFERKANFQEAFSRASHPRTGNLAAFNLTHGFRASPPGATANAIRITASVVASLSPGETIADWAQWKLNFVQVCEIVQQKLLYAGIRKTEGQIVMSANVPPALMSNTHLDSDAASTPFVSNEQAQLDQSTNRITAIMGDHPMSWFPIGEKNRVTDKINWLVEAQDFRRFTTVFTAREPGGKLHYLSHLQWELFYGGRVTHVSGYQPKLDGGLSKPLADKPFGLGKPAGAKVNAVLNNPGPPFTNDVYGAAWVATAATSGTPNRSDSPSRLPVPPGTF